MDLNEIIENNTIDQISRRTRLTHENLEKLFANDFKDFTKVQALGFISILEREYRADLSSLRDKCRAYFSDGLETTKAKEEPAPIESANKFPTITPMNFPRQIPRYIKPMIISIVAIGLLYAAWQTFATTMKTPDRVSDQQQDGGFFSSIINQTRSWMGPEQDNKPDTTVQVPQSDQKAWANKKEAQKNTLVITPKIENNKQKVQDSVADKKVKEENEIIKNIKAEQDRKHQKNGDQPTVEEMQSTGDGVADTGKMKADKGVLSPEVPSISGDTMEKQKAATKAKQEEARKKAEQELEKKRTIEAAARQKVLEQKALEKKMADEKAALEKSAAEKARKLKLAQEQAARAKAAKLKAASELERKKVLEAKAAKEKAAKLKAAKEKLDREKAKKAKLAKEKAAKEKAAKEKAAKNARFVIKPSRAMWMGVVDLRTMKRRTYNGTGVAAFNNPRGRWIIATSHGHFSFRAGRRVVKFNNNRKHYLIIQKGNIHEIPHATFQKLNQSKAW